MILHVKLVMKMLTSLLSKSDEIRHTLVFLDVWEFKGSRIEGCKGTNLIYLKSY